MSEIRKKAHTFLNHYEHMNAVFEKLFGYSLYLIGGTLLGFVREQDFLQNDKDMDVSYFSRYRHVHDVKAEMFTIVRTLLEAGENLVFMRSNRSVVNNYFRWQVDDVDRIDVMPTWIQDGRLFRPTFVGYSTDENIILPLRERRFYGHKVFIPNRAEEKLAQVYGPTWRTPDSGFQKQARKNAETARVLDHELRQSRMQLRELLKLTGEWERLTFLERILVPSLGMIQTYKSMKRTFTAMRSKPGLK